MTDIVAFLRARLTDDEETARAASWDEWDSAHWTAHHRAKYDGRWVIVDHAEEGVTEVTPHAADDAAVAQHIARQDPARTLREVEAKRQIIAQHERYAAERRRLMEGWDPNSDDSPILAALATVYADHPDYRPEWTP